MHRGLSAGVGDGTGHWRLELDTDLDIIARAYVRSPEGFVSRIDTTVAAIDDGGYRYDVRFFNPGTNTVKPSALRLVNPGDAAADVIIGAHDDQGDDAPEGEVTVSVAAGAAVELSAQALEQGGEASKGGSATGRESGASRCAPSDSPRPESGQRTRRILGESVAIDKAGRRGAGRDKHVRPCENPLDLRLRRIRRAEPAAGDADVVVARIAVASAVGPDSFGCAYRCRKSPFVRRQLGAGRARAM